MEKLWEIIINTWDIFIVNVSNLSFIMSIVLLFLIYKIFIFLFKNYYNEAEPFRKIIKWMCNNLFTNFIIYLIIIFGIFIFIRALKDEYPNLDTIIFNFLKNKSSLLSIFTILIVPIFIGKPFKKANKRVVLDQNKLLNLNKI